MSCLVEVAVRSFVGVGGMALTSMAGLATGASMVVAAVHISEREYSKALISSLCGVAFSGLVVCSASATYCACTMNVDFDMKSLHKEPKQLKSDAVHNAVSAPVKIISHAPDKIVVALKNNERIKK